MIERLTKEEYLAIAVAELKKYDFGDKVSDIKMNDWYRDYDGTVDLDNGPDDGYFLVCFRRSAQAFFKEDNAVGEIEFKVLMQPDGSVLEAFAKDLDNGGEIGHRGGAPDVQLQIGSPS